MSGPGRKLVTPQEDAIIAVGSNIEPLVNIPKALAELGQYVEVVAVSTFYRTAPIDRPGQPSYANGAFLVRTPLTPRELKFDVLRVIEERLGRRRSDDRYAARPIDLDVAIFGDRVVQEPDLTLPDPDITVRAFLALPLLELAPELVLPDRGEPLASLDVVGLGTDLAPMPVLTGQLRAELVAQSAPPRNRSR